MGGGGLEQLTAGAGQAATRLVAPTLSPAALAGPAREPPPPLLRQQPAPGDDVFAALAAWPTAQRYAWEAAVVSVLLAARDRGSRLVAAAALAGALHSSGAAAHPVDLSLTQCLRALPWVVVAEAAGAGGERAYALA